MIANLDEYQKAQAELQSLEDRLDRLQETNPVGLKGLTKAGIRKLIARLHEDLAVFEGTEEARATNGEPLVSNVERTPRPQRFNLDAEIGDRDGNLTLVLFLVFASLSFVNVWIGLFGLYFFPMPLVAVFVTRWAYKRHFRLLRSRANRLPG